MPKGMRQSSASLSLQILLWTSLWYSVFFLVVENAIFIWKGSTLDYTDRNFDAELFGLWLLFGVEAFRIYFAMRGNLTEQPLGLYISVVFGILTILTFGFYLLYQTYVLRVEVILIVIALVLEILEVLLSIAAALRFKPHLQN